MHLLEDVCVESYSFPSHEYTLQGRFCPAHSQALHCMEVGGQLTALGPNKS